MRSYFPSLCDGKYDLWGWVVVRFGDEHRQWNAAFDAGYAAALGKPIVTLYDHALKEVDRAAQATARTAEQGWSTCCGTWSKAGCRSVYTSTRSM